MKLHKRLLTKYMYSVCTSYTCLLYLLIRFRVFFLGTCMLLTKSYTHSSIWLFLTYIYMSFVSCLVNSQLTSHTKIHSMIKCISFTYMLYVLDFFLFNQVTPSFYVILSFLKSSYFDELRI